MDFVLVATGIGSPYLVEVSGSRVLLKLLAVSEAA